MEAGSGHRRSTQQESEALRRFRLMKASRGPRDVDPAVTPLLNAFIREQTKASKSLAAVTEAFEALVPVELARECSLVGVRSGVLTIEVTSSGVQFGIDRVLRGGAEAALKARLAGVGVRITAVKLRYAPPAA